VDEKNQLEEKTITVSPRVGLSFGYPNYVLRNYRYLINAKTNDKYKSAVVINLYKDVKYNGDVKKISEITNVSVTQINKYITQYKNSMNLDIVLKDLKPSNTTIIQVMGYCDKPLVQNTKK
jgi:intein-encoded DNA endonuclease-like protein